MNSVRFAVIADLYVDIIIDAYRDLKSMLSEIEKENVDFIVKL